MTDMAKVGEQGRVVVIAVNDCNGSRFSRAPFEPPFNMPGWVVPGYPVKYSLFPLST